LSHEYAALPIRAIFILFDNLPACAFGLQAPLTVRIPFPGVQAAQQKKCMSIPHAVHILLGMAIMVSISSLTIRLMDVISFQPWHGGLVKCKQKINRANLSDKWERVAADRF